MRKAFHHRLAYWLRLAVSGAIVFHGTILPGMVASAYAQNSDAITLGVTVGSAAPPAAVADLLASPNPAVQGQVSLTWTAPQGNVGGIPIPNQTVASYAIHYATFSVASLAGDTTSWWNQTASSQIVLQPPSYNPQAPGQLEADAISGLVPGTRYYFAIESVGQDGVTSPIDTEAASPALQANAVPTVFITSSGTPLPPSGLTAALNGGQFTLKWHPVAFDTNHNPITIDHYTVYRYSDIGSSPTVLGNVSPSSLSYTDTVGGLTYYYAVLAVATGNAPSAVSDYMDSSNQMNRIMVASDDIETRVVIPGALAEELNSENNSYGEDLDIVLARRQQDEVDVTLRSYHVGAYKVKSGDEILGFSFSQAGMQVELGLGAILGVGQPNSTVGQALQGRTTAGSIAQIVSVYWFNGGSYIRISDPVLTSNQSLAVSVKNVGTYQVRATQIPTQFQLTQGSPYPRVITPNDPSQNNRVFWFFDNPTGDPVSGTIYDIRGAKVRDLVVNGQSPTANSLVWDGHDNRGSVVRSGVYLYKVWSGKDIVTGTVVVAR